MKLMPASSALWMMREQSSWSVLPWPPNIIAPRQYGLTLMPVRPSVRYFMVLLVRWPVRAVARYAYLSGAAFRYRLYGTLFRLAREGTTVDGGQADGGRPRRVRADARRSIDAL